MSGHSCSMRMKLNLDCAVSNLVTVWKPLKTEITDSARKHFREQLENSGMKKTLGCRSYTVKLMAYMHAIREQEEGETTGFVAVIALLKSQEANQRCSH